TRGNIPDNPEIISFVTRLIKEESQNPEYQTDPSILDLKTEWDKKDYENGTLKKFFIDHGTKLNDMLPHIFDWLRDMPVDQYPSLRGIPNIDVAYDHADRYFVTKNKHASEEEDFEGREIVYKFPDGMFFAK